MSPARGRAEGCLILDLPLVSPKNAFSQLRIECRFYVTQVSLPYALRGSSLHSRG